MYLVVSIKIYRNKCSKPLSSVSILRCLKIIEHSRQTYIVIFLERKGKKVTDPWGGDETRVSESVRLVPGESR